MFSYKLSTQESKKEDIVTSSCEGLALIEAIDQANEAYLGLDQSMRELTEVQDVMENIQMSLDHLDKFGAKAVETLNVDQSLEKLLGVSAKQITVDSAKEGLGEALSNAWDAFVKFIKNLWEHIVAFFKSLFGFSEKAASEAKQLADEVKSGSPEQKANLEKTPVKKDEGAKQKAAAAKTPAQVIAAFKPQGESMISKKDFDTIVKDTEMLITLSLNDIVDVKTKFSQIDKVLEEVDGGQSDPDALIEDLHKEAEKHLSGMNSHFQLLELKWNRKLCVVECRCKAQPNAAGATLKDLGWTAASIESLPKQAADIQTRAKSALPNFEAQAKNGAALADKLASFKKTSYGADAKKFAAEWRRIISGTFNNKAQIVKATGESMSVVMNTVVTLKRAWKKATGKKLDMPK